MAEPVLVVGLGDAARFAAAQGAGTLALAVTEANREARALYDALGFHRIGSYAYWTR